MEFNFVESPFVNTFNSIKIADRLILEVFVCLKALLLLFDIFSLYLVLQFLIEIVILVSEVIYTHWTIEKLWISILNLFVQLKHISPT